MLQDLLKKGAYRLKKIGIENPLQEARYILCKVLEKELVYLVMHSQKTISQEDKSQFFSYVEERSQRKPLSKIVGKKSFYKYDFSVSEKTLDPRPDSETLIEAVLADTEKEATLKILDLGTGSGCLILTLLKELPKAQGVGVDISPEALVFAKENAKNLDLEKRVCFIKSNWMDSLKEGHIFDVIISNPPYIKKKVIETLAPEVRNYDPHLALDGGFDGLAPYRVLAQNLFKGANKNTKIFFEIGAGQKDQILYIMMKRGYTCEDQFYDLSGHIRCLKFKSKTLKD